VKLLNQENDDQNEVFFSKNNSILTGKQCTRCCSFLKEWFSLDRCMCYSTHLNRPICSKQSLHLPLTPKLWEVIHKHKLNSHRETMCQMLLLLTLMGFIEDLHVLSQLSSIGLFGKERAYLHLENTKLQEVFLSGTNSLLTRKQCAIYCSC
jgi:hypothetical protein